MAAGGAVGDAAGESDEAKDAGDDAFGAAAMIVEAAGGAGDADVGPTGGAL